MQHKKALVVDSNAGSRELIRILLEHEGFQTVETGDALEAVELASATSPDLILIDLQMPAQQGYATARRLRQSGCSKNLMVALTGRELDADTAQITAAGFTTFISKPVILQGLHERLAQILSN
jgi:two-component system KDP operon response regulator KdpE